MWVVKGFMRKKSILLIMLMSITTIIKSQIITDRPDQTESSMTVKSGDLQIETGFLIGFEGEGFFSERRILAPTSLFRYGIFEGVEIRFLSQYETIKNDFLSIQGISDIEIGTKIQIRNRETENTKIAFLSHVILPRGTGELTNGEVRIINKIALSHQLGKNIGIGYNLGYNYLGENVKDDITYALSLGIGIDDKVGIYIEPYGELSLEEEFNLNFDAGFTYLANRNLQFDFSFGTGLNQRMNYISLGCSWLIEKTK